MEHLRPTYAQVNVKNLEYNLRYIKSKLLPNTGLMAVVKANAYGHGAVSVSKNLVENNVDFFGVSSIEEGIGLRYAGIQAPVLILGSQYPFEHFYEVIKHSLTPTVASYDAASELSKCAKGLNIRVGFHYKLDTGMGRIGVAHKRAFEVFKNIRKLDNIDIEGIYTHLAKAENDPRFTKKQINLLKQAAAKITSIAKKKIIVHAANSAAALTMPESHLDLVRVGLGLYGLKPSKNAKGFENLKPVMSLKSRIVYLKQMPKGSTISYGAAYKTKKVSWIATVPIGYADGYNRLLSNKGRVLVKDCLCPVVGRVTMDMIMVDVTAVDKPRVGEEVILVGSGSKRSITMEDIAGLASTISYETACQISSRVPRRYVE